MRLWEDHSCDPTTGSDRRHPLRPGDDERRRRGHGRRAASTPCGHAATGAPPARALLITGEGRGFCSGANLSAGPAGRSADGDGKPDAGGALETLYNPLVTFIREMPTPLVTAVNGAAAGVGCSLALLGDLIVAAESAYFLQAFRRIGLVPDGGSTYLLPRMIGRARAMEMALLGERVIGRRRRWSGAWSIASRRTPSLVDRPPWALAPRPGDRAGVAGSQPADPVGLARRRLVRPAAPRAPGPEGRRQDPRFHRGRVRLPAETAGQVHGPVT